MSAIDYAKAAVAYQNDLDNRLKNPDSKYYNPDDGVTRWRSWSCWNAAVVAGLVLQ